jgi:hypothetical protein
MNEDRPTLTIEPVVEPVCDLYWMPPSGGRATLVGQITSFLQLQNVRIQIKKEKLSGYFIAWDGWIININNEGKLDRWPAGFYDLMDHQLNYLVDFGD